MENINTFNLPVDRINYLTVLRDSTEGLTPDQISTIITTNREEIAGAINEISRLLCHVNFKPQTRAAIEFLYVIGTIIAP